MAMDMSQAKKLYENAKPYRFMGEKQNLKKAFQLYIKAAEMGYAPAQFEVGYAYSCGFGVIKDERKAFEWYLAAAQQGHMDAQRNIGLQYQEGRGVDVDYVKAREWYMMAAEAGDYRASLWLGELFEKGLGGCVNFDTALEFYKRSMNKGHSKGKEAYERLAKQLGTSSFLATADIITTPDTNKSE